MNTNPISAPTSLGATPAKPKKTVPLWVKLLAGVAVLHFTGAVLSAIAGPATPLTEAQIAERDARLAARERYRSDRMLVLSTQGDVTATLRNPGSAEFRNVGVYRPFAGQDTAVVCGEVNAENGFGGRSGFQAFVGFLGSVGIEDGSAEFVQTHRQLCVDAPTPEGGADQVQGEP